MSTHEMIVIVAPYGTVTDVRNAGGSALADGIKLEGGGVSWALLAGDALQQDVKGAGGEVYERGPDDTLDDILDVNGYARKKEEPLA